MITFIRRYVLNNIGLKLVSLLIAVLLWMAFARNPVTEIAINVPIELQHVPDQLEISSEHIPEVQIRVRGPERVVHRLDPTEVHAAIDLAGARPGERTYDLTGRQISTPQGVEVVQVVPSQFRVSFDRRATKKVDVRPRVIGTFASGYRIDEVVADPSEVTIVGPEKRVTEIENAITDPVDATGVVGRATFTTNIYVADPLVRIARPGPIHVTVTTEKMGKQGSGQATSAEQR